MRKVLGWILISPCILIGISAFLLPLYIALSEGNWVPAELVYGLVGVLGSFIIGTELIL